MTIKREEQGLVSRFLHDAVKQGDILSARHPSGDFTLMPGARPVVLISAGVGLTPMTSMLGALTHADEVREVFFVHGARDGDHSPLRQEIRRAAASNPRISSHIAYSQPRQQDVPGRDFDSHGRIDGELLAKLLPSLAADFYLCGPIPFMQHIQDALTTRGVPAVQIRQETFGPVG